MNDSIEKALEVLKNGGIILYPTDTIWGIGCDATNKEAVARIYAVKRREDNKSMLVLLDNENRLPSYISEVPEIAWDLMEAAVDPLTIIFPGAKNLAENLVNSDQTIGIRISSDEFCRTLISRLKKPIVSTSANFSGEPAPGHFGNINPGLHSLVDYVVDWRQDDNTRSKASSIIKLGLSGEISIIRP